MKVSNESKRERASMKVFNELVANQLFIFRQDKIFYICMNKCRIPGPAPWVGRGVRNMRRAETNYDA